MKVRCVPFAAPHDTYFSVPFGESGRSKMIFQRRLCAHNGLMLQKSLDLDISQ